MDIISNGIRVVSFDIFDTLLLRTCRRPQDVFGMMYRENPESFPAYMKEDDWIALRKAAEAKAREHACEKSGGREVTLAGIYAEMPAAFADLTGNWQELELECEKKACFLNPQILRLMEYIRENTDCRIVLCSDMYLISGQIEDILVCNDFDMSLTDNLYISSEYGVSKRCAGLYQRVLAGEDVLPSEMLHIGDHYYNDVGAAASLGIHTYYYSVISEAEYMFPFLRLETVMNDVASCGVLYPLRLMASSAYGDHEKMSDSERFWFDQGAMIYGPFMTCGMEWVLDYAQEHDVSIIRPFMREGWFFTELLQRAAARRERRFDIAPVYLSRFSVFAASFDSITEKEIRYLVRTHGICVQDVFRVLKIEDQIGYFSKYAKLQTADLENIVYGEKSEYDNLLDYLERREIIGLIRERNQKSGGAALAYLKEMGMCESCLTLDVGWSGNIQSALEDLLKRHGIQPHMTHLLLVCSSLESIIGHTLDGCRIRGYVGNHGSGRKPWLQLFGRIMELACMCGAGTTTGYEVKDGQNVPVTQSIPYPAWQLDAMRQIQKGIISFQEVYLDMAEKKPHIRELADHGEALCQIIGRLHSYPLAREADAIGRLEYDQNFGGNLMSPILNASLLRDFERETPDTFYGSFHNQDINWYSGLNVLPDKPLFYYEKALYLNRQYRELSILYLAERVRKVSGSRRLVLAMAGEDTKTLIRILAIAGWLYRVEAVVDNDPLLYGSSIAGIHICSPEHDFGDAFYVFATRKRERYVAIYGQIRRAMGREILSVGYFEDHLEQAEKES